MKNESEKGTMKKISLIAMLAALFTAALLAQTANFTSSADQKPQGTDVKIDNFSFAPGDVTVPLNTTITWTNRDDIPHNVVSTDGAFKSKVLDTDEKYSFTFSKPGTYSYFCSIHPKMTAKIVVK
jgi:plastocyanin